MFQGQWKTKMLFFQLSFSISTLFFSMSFYNHLSLQSTHFCNRGKVFNNFFFRRMRCSRTRSIKVIVLTVLVAFILIQLIGSSGIGFGRKQTSSQQGSFYICSLLYSAKMNIIASFWNLDHLYHKKYFKNFLNIIFVVVLLVLF